MVDSHLNQGTCFTIYLPALAQETERTSIKTEIELVNDPLIDTHMLILDDEILVRQVIGAMLEQLGSQVTYTMNGQETVTQYREAYEKGACYDVVIVDLTIPGGMGGLEAAQKILQIDPTAKLIVSSGYANDPILANYEAYGFKGVVVKPYRLADLAKVVKQVLG